MPKLPTDIQLEVLDNVHLKSDLKALCLVSKSWRALAIPRLYRDVSLITWPLRPRDRNRIPHTSRFVRSVAAGAGLHLKYTRILTIENSQPPPEPTVNPLNFESLSDHEDNHEDGVAVEYGLGRILEMIPRNILHTFRYISDTPLTFDLTNRMHVYQPNLQHVHATVEEVRFKNAMPLTFYGKTLRTLDIATMDPGTVQVFLRLLLVEWPQLERLSIGLRAKDSTAPTTGYDLGSPPKYFDRSLLEFNLCYFPCHGGSFQTMSKLFNLSKLKRMTLQDCPNADLLLESMGELARRQTISLRHLAVYVRNPDSVVSLLQNCTSLTDLHLAWETFTTTGTALPATLESIVPNLRTLALQFREEATMGADSVAQTMFKNLLRPTLGIRYIACQIRIEDFNTCNWQQSNFHQRLSNFGSLYDLRVVHFRISPDDLLLSAIKYSEDEVTCTAQRFANSVFAHMEEQGVCSKLQVVIVGCFNRDENSSVSDFQIPRHCFVKRHQCDSFQQIVVVGVPIPAYMIRQLEPECDLLDFDFDCDWVGGWASRIRNV
ncbi:hypothetical protein P280DRAFT_432294 [Massarina eburnea CBS 473.64]|uniref:F-box domain-containing protein n=1 Tax=Massarina eburnea CBS 473.64 TaxID=1395130 RepID=A0A6A6RRX9_9PLEO|nr:hypothetical protein P280DRAFT_432294 [Massarina eburnea CBS 473.64]